MKALQLVPAMEQGGVERGIVEMNRVLVDAGIENVVVSAGGRLVQSIRDAGSKHIALDVKSKNPFTYFLRALKLRKILKEEKPDVVVAHSRVPAWLFVWANRTLGIPWITFAHGANSISRYSKVMTRGDLTVTPSRYIADYLKDAYGLSEDKIRVIPRAIDHSKFDTEKLDVEFLEAKKREWGLSGKFVVMGLGRITQLKGYDTLIRATAIAKESVPNIRTVIVGEAEEIRKEVEENLRELVKELKLEDYVVFAGNQSKVAEAITLSNVVVSSNTKKPEAFGRSMAEALAMNRPVIAKAFGGALDIVEDGKNGVLVSADCENVDEAFAKAIVKVSQTSYRDLRTPALEKFSFERMAGLSLDVYKEFGRSQASFRLPGDS